MKLIERVTNLNTTRPTSDKLTKDGWNARKEIGIKYAKVYTYGQLLNFSWLLFNHLIKKEGWDEQFDIEKYIQEL